MSNLWEHGKIPPQAIDLEESILGTIMSYQELFIDVKDILTKEVFYKEANSLIYNAIVKLESENKSFDIMMVTNYLKNSEELEIVGGAYYITQLTNNIFPSAIEEKALILKEKFYKRELIKISSDTINKSFNDGEDVFDIISSVSSSLENLILSNNKNVHHIEDCVVDVMKVIDNNATGKISGMLTGWKDYDEFSKGDQNGDLIIYAGETSQGKTSAALCKAYNQALMGYNVAVFSYEMTKNQLTARLMALAIDISAKTLLMDKLEGYQFEQLNAKINKLIDSNIYIIEVERNDFDWLKSKIKTIKTKYNIHSVIVDYAQLISVHGLPRNQQVGHVANGLKFLAKHKNINIPITLLSQLARDKDRPKPTLSRLKESGDIENAADTVVGFWRPSHYGMDSVQIIEDGVAKDISTKDIAIAHIMKGRNIGLKDIILSWDGRLTKFSDYKKNENNVAPF